MREPRLAAAIHWYEKGEISQEKAASVAGLDRTGLLLALACESADAFVVDFDDLKRELECGTAADSASFSASQVSSSWFHWWSPTRSCGAGETIRRPWC